MIEYRTAKGGVSATSGTLEGLVTPFNDVTTIGDVRKGGFREQIAPGAFTKTLQERDVVLLFNHNTDMPLARVSAGNLSLSQQRDGLHATAQPVETSYGKDLRALAEAGVVKGMSFGFEVVKDAWTDDEGRAASPATGTNRTVQEVRLHEVSAVTFPAYENTQFSARDAISAAREARSMKVEIPAEWDWRDKYNGLDRHNMAKSGEAMPDGSYPIKDAEDLQNAIHAVGRGNADHDAIRKHIIDRAKALGLSADIPDNWNADGSLKQENSADVAPETRDDPDGKEYTAIRKAIAALKADDPHTALQTLIACGVPDMMNPDDTSGDDDAEDGKESHERSSDDEIEYMRDLLRAAEARIQF